MLSICRVGALVLVSLGLAWGQTNEDLRREREELQRKLAEIDKRLAEGEGTQPAEAPASGGAKRTEAGVEMGEVVVTATGTQASTKTTGSTISTVTSREIGQQGSSEMLEPLRGVPGILVTRTGLSSGFATVNTRGTNNNHTLFQLEGFELSRDGGAFFELDTLPTDGTAGIEVLRGPQSGLYGSDALGGVINFRVRRGEGPARAVTSLEVGSFATNREKFDIQGGNETFGYSVVGSRLEQSNGELTHTEFDGHTDFDVESVIGRFDYDLSQETRLMLILHAREDNKDLPTSGSVGPRFNLLVEPDAHAEKDTELIGLDFGHWVTEWWDSHIQLERYALNRDNFNRPSPNNPFGNFNRLSEYTKGSAHFVNRLYPCKWDTITVGAEFEVEESEEVSNLAPSGVEVERDDKALFMQHEFNLWDTVYLTPNVRWDDNSSFGPAWTYRVAGAVWIEQTGTKPRASVGTGVVAPSFLQAFDTQFGNPSLEPEENFGWDFGVDQWLCDERLRLSATYFHNKLDNLIFFQTLSLVPFRATNVNAGRARSEGIEAELHWEAARDLLTASDVLSTSASYTWTQTEALSSNNPTNPGFKVGGSLFRIPTNEAHLNVDYTIADKLGFNVDLNYVGSRRDRSFSSNLNRPAREIVSGYLRVDLAGHWDVPWVKGLRMIGRWENVFDKFYEESLGFPSPGSNVLGGLEYEIRL